jgi:hypothetical protein
MLAAAGGMLLSCGPPSGAAPAPQAPAGDPALAQARQLADAGTPQLALNRIEQSQPQQPSARDWPAWEALRVELLAQLQSREALFARAQALPADAPADLRQLAYGLAAQAALDSGEPRRAGNFLRRQLWGGGALAEPAERQARRRVIEVYLAEGRPRDAYRAMLRFQQDFRPLNGEESLAFVRGLAAGGLGKEALSFAAGVDAKHPSVVMAELGAGVITPAAALAAAKATLARSDDPGSLRLLLEAARRAPDRSAEVTALERLLNLPQKTAAQYGAVDAAELAEAYGRRGQELANAGQLLVGEDAAWLAAAEKRAASDPVGARALWALLAKLARSDANRRQASDRLLASLRAGKLNITAVRLFAAGSPLGLPSDAVDARRSLGQLADESRLWSAAADYWASLPPPDTGALDWSLERARVLLAADQSDAAEAVVMEVGGARAPLSPESVERVLQMGEALLAAGKLAGAERLLAASIKSGDVKQRREALFAMGRLQLAQGKAPEAADFFMRSALATGANATDPLAIAARSEAAAALDAAGWRADADAQRRWLLKNVKDPGFRELLQREAAGTGR